MKARVPPPTLTSVCHESTAILGTPLQTQMMVSKENIVGFETWAIIFMFNTWIWKMELDQKCILNVLHLVLQLPANHTICLGFITQNLTEDQKGRVLNTLCIYR